MTTLRVLPAVLCGLLLGAHFLRGGELGLALGVGLGIPLLLFLVARRWALRVVQLVLVAGAVLWVVTLIEIAAERQVIDAPWGRMALILGAVAAVTGASAALLQAGDVRARFPAQGSTAVSVAAFCLTLVVLVPVQLVVDPPGLLAERFLPTLGWLELLALGIYAAWLAEIMIDPARSGVWRRRTWRLFSVVFFAQLLIGLSGFDRFLMTGRLHLPIPALIVAGPLYRGGGYFMPILLGATLLLVGPAWCSHLCYVGAWDDASAAGLRITPAEARGTVRRPARLPAWRRSMQWGMLALVVLGALGMRLAGMPTTWAMWAAVAFGIGGMVVAATWSRRTAAMMHCTAYCPIGIVTTVVGRINPFRLRIGDGCTECGRCSLPCRYDALRPEDIVRRRPGPSCTLCGDCVTRCRDGQMGYWLPGLSPDRARAVFIALAVALHAGFLGVARI